jgi:hypothetical protein
MNRLLSGFLSLQRSQAWGTRYPWSFLDQHFAPLVFLTLSTASFSPCPSALFHAAGTHEIPATAPEFLTFLSSGLSFYLRTFPFKAFYLDTPGPFDSAILSYA